MIRVKKGRAPAKLKQARDKHLMHAVDEFDAGGTPWTKSATARKVVQTKDFLGGYNIPEVREALYLRQHKKCAYCERDIGLDGTPIEHFRPRRGAWRHVRHATPKLIDRDCYWWLTWTWKNLLFACVTCNSGNHKGSFFPLATTTTQKQTRPIGWPLPRGFEKTDREQPLFLNPTEVDPLRHLKWVPQAKRNAAGQPLPHALWTWTLSEKTSRGKAMMDWMKLDHAADAVTGRLRRDVLPRIEDMKKAVGEGRLPAARKLWRTLLTNVLDDPESPFRAAIWCALQVWVPRRFRTLHGLKQPTRP